MSSTSSTTNAIERAFTTYFEFMGSTAMAHALSQRPFLDLALGQHLATALLSDREILEAASHHGNIGESKATLDARAQAEQGGVDDKNEQVRRELLETGAKYLERHGIKYMICAKGKTGEEMLEILKRRLENPSTADEWRAARTAMWQIFCKRLETLDRDTAAIRVGSEAVCAALNSDPSGGQDVRSVTAAVSWCGYGGDIQLLHQDSAAASMPEMLAEHGAVAATDSHHLQQHVQQGKEKQPVVAFGTFGRIVAAVFILEYLARHNIPLASPVDAVLAAVGSHFRLGNAEIVMEHLVQHCALQPIPSAAGGEHADPLAATGGSALLDAAALAQLVRLVDGLGSDKAPAESAFLYSDANFVLLQHIVQLHALSCPSGATPSKSSAAVAANSSSKGGNMTALTTSFFRTLGLADSSFGDASGQASAASASLSHGLRSTVLDMHRFLLNLGRAYHDVGGCAGISHDTARKVVYGFNKDFGFLNTDIGGAGGAFNLMSVDGNKYIVNYGVAPDDGASFFSMHCFDGADRNKAFLVTAQGTRAGAAAPACQAVCAEMARACIRQLGLRGFDSRASAAMSGTPTVHNQHHHHHHGAFYRDAILSHFTQERAEPILVRGAFSDFLSRSFLHRHLPRVAFCSNDKFARAENLISAHEPLFDPALFGLQGKVMDSWESVRHNIRPFDECIFARGQPSDAAVAGASSPEGKSGTSSSSGDNDGEGIRYVYLSTKYHTGNQTPVVAVSVRLVSDEGEGEWRPLLPKMQMSGHSYRYIDLGAEAAATFVKRDIAQVRAEAYPDGGWTRLALFGAGDLRPEELAKFTPLQQHLDGTVASTRHEEPVPAAVKPLVEDYKTTKAEVAARMAARVSAGVELDAASQAFGGHLVSASDEHYGPSRHALSPHAPAGMFDGFETARSRRPAATSHEELRVGLLHPCVIHRIEADFTFFVNNAPKEMEVLGVAPVNTFTMGNNGHTRPEPRIIELVPRQKVKHFSGGIKEFVTTMTCTQPVEQLIVRTFPCGGFNRIRAFTFSKLV